MNASQPTEIWADEIAGRIRLVQANWADDTSDARSEYIESEIENALQSVPAEERPTRLDALAQRFPTWQGQVVSAAPKDAQPADLGTDILIDMLLEKVPALSVQMRREYGKMLHAAGLDLPAEASAAPATPEPVAAPRESELDVFDELPAELAKRLKLEPGKKVNVRHGMKLLSRSLTILLALDQLVWNMWKQLAPRSRIRQKRQKDGEMRELAGRYLSGDPDVSLSQLADALEQTRQLTAGILGAVGPVGRTFARRNAAKYSPSAITDLVGMEGGGLFVAKEVRCWNKYRELANDLTEPAIEKQIHEAIVSYTEQLVGGYGRNTKSIF